MYTIHIWGSLLLTRDENYSPQVIVKDIMSNHNCEWLGKKKDPKSATKLFRHTAWSLASENRAANKGRV